MVLDCIPDCWLVLNFWAMKTPPPRIIPSERHRRILPPEVIAEMEYQITQDVLEAVEMRIYLQAPLTQEEIHQVVSPSCDCEPRGRNHAVDCNILSGLKAPVKKRREHLLGP